MISFIIIGRNEGWKLPKCIQSVIKTIEYNKVENFEILYVDSSSTDNSIETAKQFNKVQVFKISGEINAAIARNIGAQHSSGDILFFIDGDMELIETFFPLIIKENELIRDFVSGNWVNYFYDHNNNFINKKKYYDMEQDTIETTTGGLFVIKRITWDLVGGMNGKFKKSQDIDLGLRLAQKKYFLLRKKEILARHHTISYLDSKRMWQDFFKCNHLYGRSLLYRTHIFNRHVYKRIYTNDYSLILLILGLVLFAINQNLGLVLFMFYLVVILSRGQFSPEKVLYYFLRDISVFLGLFLFFQKKNNFIVEKIC